MVNEIMRHENAYMDLPPNYILEGSAAPRGQKWSIQNPHSFRLISN